MGRVQLMLLHILQAIQAILAVLIIVMVLIHSPKGDGIGGLGGASQLFTTQRGAESGLNRLTAYLVGAFFVVAIVTGLFGHYFIGV